MTGLLGTWSERIRRHLLAGVEADIARLQREVEAQRSALQQAEALRSLLAVLEERTARTPEQLAAELRPFIEEVVRDRTRAQRRRRRRALAVAGTAAVVAAGALWWWRDGAPGVSLAARAEAHAVAAVASPTLAASVHAKPAAAAGLVLEQEIGGFGLGRSAASDADLARAVRSRLSACPSLAGAEIRFAAKDGWVWLRGRASDAGREAAGAALGDMGEGVVVVNQIESGPDDLVAER